MKSPTSNASPAFRKYPGAVSGNNIDTVKDEKSSFALKNVLFSTLRMHTKDFENVAATNVANAVNSNIEWEQVKGKTLQIEATAFRVDSNLQTQNSNREEKVNSSKLSKDHWETKLNYH